MGHEFFLSWLLLEFAPCDISSAGLAGGVPRNGPPGAARWLLDQQSRQRARELSQQEQSEQPQQQCWFSGGEFVPHVHTPSMAQRPRGLPIGNFTSQFWSNCPMNPLDHFIKRDLLVRAYLRYVDDLAVFSDSKQELWLWRKQIIDRLASMRLTVHEGSSQPAAVVHGIPWLGFVVFPTHRRVKARNVRNFSRRLLTRWRDYCGGKITFAELDASVQGWINHVRYADSWGLRAHLLGRPLVMTEGTG